MPVRSEDKLVVYYPNMRHRYGWWRCWREMGVNVWEARELIWQLFRRDFVAAYKKSWLGVAWFFIMPLMGIISWVFLQKSGVLNPGNVDVPYPLYVLLGTSMYSLFRQLFVAASGTLEAGKEFIQQVNFPHEAMLFKQTASEMAFVVIALGINLLVMCMYGVLPSWKALLLPLVAFPLFFLAAGLGLIVSMINVVAVDVSRAFDIALAFGLYLTPVIYSDQVSHPIIQMIIKWNPLTYLICSCRDLLIYGRLYHPFGYFVTAGLSCVVFLIAWRLFFVSEGKLIERMV